MNEINEQLKGISELITRIDAKVLDINIKLNELIKALHEYDDEDYNEPNDALKEAISAYNETVANKEYGESSFEAFQDEVAINKRMDVIGQNGNTGEHYDEDSDKWSNKWELGGEG
jgi:hypothetical protein